MDTSKNEGAAAPRDGYIVDYISGLEVRSTPEEVASVQRFARSLVEDYGYPKKNIRTRPQWTVRKTPSDRKGFPVDICVFDSPKHNDDGIQIIVECKQPTRKDGEEQLKSYLSFSKAELGVWFNGKERLFLRKRRAKRGSGFEFETIPNIPVFGQRIEDIGLFKRKDLKPTHNLKSIFSVIRNTLAGNAVGTTRDEELARQLINLVFCKIWDERFTAPDAFVEFRAGVDEEPDDVKARIERLFGKVKSKYKEILDVSDSIDLDAKSVAYVVGELQNFCLIDTQRDVIGDAFETFIGYALKGGQGQFFTPRNIVQLMTKVVGPTNDHLLLDPACGSGGFLVEGLRSIWANIDHTAAQLGWDDRAVAEEKFSAAVKNIFGVEKDAFLSKVAKAYMAILGDGKGGIFCEDSLDAPQNWKSKTRQHVNFDKFDVILTNPPFGKDIKITGEVKLKQYELARVYKTVGGKLGATAKRKDKQQPDVLFIERCIQLLKDGGKLGIILPETFFHAPRADYVRSFMQRHNIFYVIDLPHNTFRPHNNAKCIAVFIQKNVKQQPKIGMAVAEEMGHDHNGKEIFRWDSKKQKVDKTKLWDDIPLIEQELKSGKKSKYTFEVSAKECAANGVYVPRFYWQKKEEEIRSMADDLDFDLVSIQQLIDEKVIQTFDGHGSPEAENKGNGEVPYIRVKDIVNWELYQDPTSKIPLDVYKEMTTKIVKSKDNSTPPKIVRVKELHEGDVIYVRRGSYRIGSVAMVSPFDTEVLLTRELTVLRVKDGNARWLTPYYLLYALSHRITQMQTKNKVLIETTLPNIGDRWRQLMLPIPKDAKKLRAISVQIEAVVRSKWDAVEGILKIKKELGDLTT